MKLLLAAGSDWFDDFSMLLATGVFGRLCFTEEAQAQHLQTPAVCRTVGVSDHGQADSKARCNLGNTPLHLASRAGLSKA